MKSTRVRVILAVAAAGVALTACSPSQAGAAAIVGKDRISAGELDKNVREYEAALAKANVSASQLQFPGSIPQVVLFQLATSAQRAKVAESKGITVTEAEIDQVISGGGGAAQYEQQMLQQAVAPSKTREFTRASLLITKLMAKYGGGTDEAAIQKGQVQVIKDLQSVPITWNPRYGTINEQRSEQQPNLFVESARFGAVPAAPPAAPPQQ
ncbi:peptidyl-prolyl cis-trans isomerase SurA [Streptosporangium subroseum]|uniref:Peptidyl-prolyl cis-trans isomerase SurA n=1 Tax=Streptosporangium subroseum TaxID=106412 RepID=A0A239MF87_9ACTN|nr:SurA N-terminal domain-containing protein [Streptosporangium subroseum]SNT41707.1 peptidyl-prolyl cis-trans isomerase SurA [Streptosporangium subroseum]